MSLIKKDPEKKITLEGVINAAVQIPGVKVNRDVFLQEQFKDADSEKISLILEKGPIEAKCSREELHTKAQKLINQRTMLSTSASFVAGLPGGLAMAAAIPADIIQFYGVALRLAQELAYLYGEEELWNGNQPNDDKVTNQLILYCGVMLGAAGATQAVRTISSSLAKQILKTLPRKALTKTFYYPIVKSIAKAFGAKMTKEVFAKGVSKTIPIIGGVISGGVTLVTMKPMGTRLFKVLDQAHFEYTKADFEADWKDITKEYNNDENEMDTPTQSEVLQEKAEENSNFSNNNPILEKITQAKQMLDAGIITAEEFEAIKTRLITQL